MAKLHFDWGAGNEHEGVVNLLLGGKEFTLTFRTKVKRNSCLPLRWGKGGR